MGEAIAPGGLVSAAEVAGNRDVSVLSRLKGYWAPLFGYAVLLGGICE